MYMLLAQRLVSGDRIGLGYILYLKCVACSNNKYFYIRIYVIAGYIYLIMFIFWPTVDDKVFVYLPKYKPLNNNSKFGKLNF